MAEEITAPMAGSVHLDVSALSVINYALQQNGVPAVRSINIRNETDVPLENVDLTITATSGLCLPYSKHFDFIGAGSTFSAGAIKLLLNGETLANLTEKTTGVLQVSLAKNGAVLASRQVEITALAFDEWHGYGFYPELLAAFVMPNHPELTRLIARAAELLEKWTKDPSLDGYQTRDPNRVLKQAAAVYGAIQEQNIVYSVPPASFEPAGQRVRLCDAIVQQKMGTCLDLTLLYAACLEAIGLHPILILKPGHIFAGVWLEELTFPEAVQDDAALITKRLADGIHEIAVMECTAMCSGKNMSFDDARAAAEQQLTGADALEAIIDVRRARLSGTSPLPIRIATANGWQIQRPEVKERKLTDAPQAIGEAVVTDDSLQEVLAPKKVQWERKLLDLGLRNALINMRLSKNMVPILTASVDELENALNSGSDFSIHPRPADLRMDGGVNLETMHELQGQEALIASEFKSKRLRSAYTESELTKTLKNLYRASKTAIEENGANTLYLAMGLLRWYETPRSTKPRFAPLVLIPVEMVRKSAAQGYVIRLRDEDAQMNVTMLEKLKQDFRIVINGLDPLPTDEHGIDTRKVFTIVRKAVMNQARWDVLESAYLGIFSFSQFVMWNDIRNRSDDLSKNKIVRSLMDGKLCWDAVDMTIGEKVPEDGVFLPMSADASQLFAIESACKGESFVLHGPPGTGKSQTITTLIANALAQGKSVLFVAEKMAALEVVQKRLDKIGIGPFCLELHSNKSKKRSVLEQLRLATEVTRGTTAEEYAARAGQLSAQRAELDKYASALHRRHGCGKTLFELVSAYEENITAPDIAPFAPEYVNSLTPEDLTRQASLAGQLVAAAQAVDHPHGHPLEAVCCTQYSQQIRYALPQALREYRSAMEKLHRPLEDLCQALGEPVPVNYAGICRMAGVAQALITWQDLPRTWASPEDPTRLLTDTQQMAEHFITAGNIAGKLLEIWRPEFLEQDGKALCRQWDELAAKWFLPRLTGQSGMVRRLRAYAKGDVQKDTLRDQLAQLAACQTEKAAADLLFATCGDALGFLYAGAGTDYSQVRTAAQTALETASRMREALGADSLRIRFAGDKSLAAKLLAMDTAWKNYESTKQQLYSLLALSDHADAEDYLAQQNILCDRLESNADKLKDWIAWNAVAEEAATAGLGSVVDAYRGGCAHDQLISAYHKAVYKALAMAVIDSDEALCTFSGAVFNEKIRQFKKLDAEVTLLTQQEIYCRLAARVPNFAKEAAHSSELGILQRAIRSGGRGVSIRKLFEQLPNLLPRLCPCMLMSPISAAQYLEPNRAPFDLVVFDEASQLPTCKAVGALARGENAVIVGDPKQMPPTAFFVTNTADEENLDAEDLESILDDCLALNIPQTHLLWHYRSRHESLIAFSNAHFYENKLYTFPSVNDRASKVNLVHVDGTFERSKTRQNRAEAEAIVAELKRRCHDEALKGFSVGVVTFNINQQNLIDDLLMDACREDSELEAWAFQSEEPVFIKNLENVQGDERDVILFSIGYGPDEHGKVYMNFGPLNRDGGWRRLNVAITRARQEMTVFATLRPEQINLSRTSAEGVAALKAFLEYAEKKVLPQDERTSLRSLREQEGIAKSICAYLQEHGFETERWVGHSEYRIDIGVIDPKAPEQYRLGILLDGTGYGTAKTTRDREMAQIGVLNGLGWNITRVWTMDWWDNSQREKERILRLLTQPPKTETPPKTEPNVKPVLAAAVVPTVPESTAPVYKSAVLKQSKVSSEDFLLPKYETAIRNKISAVMAAEAPVSRSLLTRRVVQSFGITRAGSRMQAYMDSIYQKMGLYSTHQGEEVFFWNADQDPESYDRYRTAENEQDRRDADEIPIQEAAGAACQALRDQLSLNEEDLIREGAKLLGYTRLGSAVTALMKDAIVYCTAKGKIVTSTNGNYTLAE